MTGSPFVFLVLAALTATSAQANLGEVYGFGSRASALAGANAGGGFDAFAAYYNPAGVTFLKDKRVALSFGVTYNQPEFGPIDNVVIENDWVSTLSGPRFGNVSTDDYRATFGAVLGATFRLLPKLWNLSGGITAFGPFKQIAYLDSGQPYIPEYVLHRARTQRPQVIISGGVEPLEGFSVGAGVNTVYTVTSKADVLVQTNTSRPSTMTLSATAKPKLIPFFGVLYNHKNLDRTASALEKNKVGAWSLGAVFRMEGKSDLDMDLRTNAAALSPLDAIPVRFGATSVMYYDPMIAELGGSIQYTDWGRLYAQVGYEFWNEFEAPGITVTPGSGGTAIGPGGPAPFDAKNIVVPRVGHEITLGSATIRAGYSYRPSIFKGAPNGAGNYLDPARDMITAGFGWKFERIMGEDLPVSLDLHLTYHAMRSITVQKSAGNEGGNLASQKIGAPGYEGDGHLWGGGVSLTTAL